MVVEGGKRKSGVHFLQTHALISGAPPNTMGARLRLPLSSATNRKAGAREGRTAVNTFQREESGETDDAGLVFEHLFFFFPFYYKS